MKIFLSYNRQNQSFVTQIADQLRTLNVGTSGELFFDQDNLGSGDIWAQKIQDALVNSDACLVFVGEQGIGGWQSKEVLTAISRLETNESSFRIIPVIVPHSNRDNVQKSFPWFLADTQWIEFTSSSDPDAFQKLVVALRENAPPPFPIPEGITNPYKGLESFGVDDAAFFFGRTFDVNRVFYYHLRLGSNQFGKQFLAIIGNSGSGKSSFAKAGLLASLKANRFEGSANWLQIILTPDDNPLLKLATALEKAGVISFSTDFKNSALKDPETLRERLEVFGRRVVLLIDQFEEVLTQCTDNVIRTAFLSNLTEAVKSDYLVCFITMRSDFYASFAPYREFNFLLLSNPYTLTEIDASTNGDEWHRYMRDIITKPAKLREVTIEQSLVNRIITELREINGVLPILQLALQQLWRGKRNTDQISTSDYDRLAGGQGRGIAGVIETHANDVYDLVTKNGTDTQAINLFKAIFIRLVETTGSKDDVRKTVSQKNLVWELASRFGEDQIQQMLLDLSRDKNRLIRIKKDTNGEIWIDIVHEVLIRKWEKLKGWVNERRDAFAYRQILDNDIIRYNNGKGELYTGKDLEEVIKWQNENPDLYTKDIETFIEASQKRIEEVRLELERSEEKTLIMEMPSHSPITRKTVVKKQEKYYGEKEFEEDQSQVFLGVATPRTVVAGSEFVARFTAYTKYYRKTVASNLNKESPKSDFLSGLHSCQWKIGSKVTVYLSANNLKINTGPQEFKWNGKWEIVRFDVEVPFNYQTTQTILKFDVAISGICIATLRPEIVILSNTPRSQEDPKLSLETKSPRSAFASYSSLDRRDVLSRVRSLQIYTNIDVFFDCLSLRPGEKWKGEISNQIRGREIFWLFWSRHAMKSAEVEWEWRNALKEKDLCAIQPHPLEPSDIAPPPADLADLQFGTAYELYLMVLKKSWPKRLLHHFRLSELCRYLLKRLGLFPNKRVGS